MQQKWTPEVDKLVEELDRLLMERRLCKLSQENGRAPEEVKVSARLADGSILYSRGRDGG